MESVFLQDFGVSACAQKPAVLWCLTIKKLKMNQRVPNKNADLPKKISLMGTEHGIRNSRKILLTSTHLFHLLAPHHSEWPYLAFWVRLNYLHTGVGLFHSQCTNGAWCTWRTADVEQKSKRLITYYLPVPCTTLQMGHWFTGSWWWLCGLAQKNCTEHLMTRVAQMKKISP